MDRLENALAQDSVASSVPALIEVFEGFKEDMPEDLLQLMFSRQMELHARIFGLPVSPDQAASKGLLCESSQLHTGNTTNREVQKQLYALLNPEDDATSFSNAVLLHGTGRPQTAPLFPTDLSPGAAAFPGTLLPGSVDAVDPATRFLLDFVRWPVASFTAQARGRSWLPAEGAYALARPVFRVAGCAYPTLLLALVKRVGTIRWSAVPANEVCPPGRQHPVLVVAASRSRLVPPGAVTYPDSLAVPDARTARGAWRVVAEDVEEAEAALALDGDEDASACAGGLEGSEPGAPFTAPAELPDGDSAPGLRARPEGLELALLRLAGDVWLCGTAPLDPVALFSDPTLSPAENRALLLGDAALAAPAPARCSDAEAVKHTVAALVQEADRLGACGVPVSLRTAASQLMGDAWHAVATKRPEPSLHQLGALRVLAVMYAKDARLHPAHCAVPGVVTFPALVASPSLSEVHLPLFHALMGWFRASDFTSLAFRAALSLWLAVVAPWAADAFYEELVGRDTGHLLRSSGRSTEAVDAAAIRAASVPPPPQRGPKRPTPAAAAAAAAAKRRHPLAPPPGCLTAWLPYIARHYYFYVLPLREILASAARDAAKIASSADHTATLERVLALYSPDLMAALDYCADALHDVAQLTLPTDASDADAAAAAGGTAGADGAASVDRARARWRRTPAAGRRAMAPPKTSAGVSASWPALRPLLQRLMCTQAEALGLPLLLVSPRRTAGRAARGLVRELTRLRVEALPLPKRPDTGALSHRVLSAVGLAPTPATDEEVAAAIARKAIPRPALPQPSPFHDPRRTLGPGYLPERNRARGGALGAGDGILGGQEVAKRAEAVAAHALHCFSLPPRDAEAFAREAALRRLRARREADRVAGRDVAERVRLRAATVRYRGDPMLQPAKTVEIALLAWALVQVSVAVNKALGLPLQPMLDDEVLYRVRRRVHGPESADSMAPPTTVERQLLAARRALVTAEARVNLRPFARKSTLGSLVCASAGLYFAITRPDAALLALFILLLGLLAVGLGNLTNSM